MTRILTIIILSLLFAVGQVAHAQERIPERQYVFGQPLPPGCKMDTMFSGTYPQAYFVTENTKLEIVCSVGWAKNLVQFWHWLQALTIPEVLPNKA